MVRALQPADPRLIGPYRLVGQLGSGGMGRVFLAMSAGGRPVAVKMIRAELAADPDFRSRFSREVAAARRVNGLFTALVVDADVDAQVPWLATAYVAGPSLAETVREHGPLSAKSVLALAAGLAEGLVAIHAAGVVHGDLKPSNVLLAEDGPRVIDFGISHAAEAAPLTHPNLVMGSPGFMSPEQAMGKNVGPRSDVFSLGTVLAFASTGERPFGTGTPVVLLDRVIHGSPNLDKVPPEVRPLAERCLAKNPDDRPTAAGLLADMGAVQAATDWLPESIMRMFPRDFPSLGEDDRKGVSGVGSSTLTVTMGSAAHDAVQLPRQAQPGNQTKPAGQPPVTGQPRAGYLAPPDDQPRTGSQRRPAEQARPAGQAPTDLQPPTGDQPRPAELTQTGDQLQPHDRQGTAAQPPSGPEPQANDPADPDLLDPGYQPDPVHQPDRGDQPQGGGSASKTRSRSRRPLVAASVIVGLLAASGAAGYALLGLSRHPSGSPTAAQGTSSATGSAAGGTSSSPAGLSSVPPVITGSFTYPQGSQMVFVIYYSDPGNNADGFGFMGVDGSSVGEQNHLFSSPADGIIETGSIAYPINQGCGTSQPRSNRVKVWVNYNADAQQSKSVTIPLVCPTS